MRKHQRGVTAIGWVILLVPLAIVAYTGIRVSTIYLNYMKVVHSLDQVAAEVPNDGQTLTTIRTAVDKHFQIESIDFPDPKDLKIKRDTGSTPWLTDLIWATAARLGHGNVFVNETITVGGDDHFSFIRRGVPGCDIIDFDIASTYWHTPQDALDKVTPRSLAIVGHVFIETLPALEQKFH